MKKITLITLSIIISAALCSCPAAENSIGKALGNANSVVKSGSKNVWE